MRRSLIYCMTAAYLTTLIAGCSKKEESGGIYTLPQVQTQTQVPPATADSTVKDTISDFIPSTSPPNDSFKTRTVDAVSPYDSATQSYVLKFDSASIPSSPIDSSQDTMSKDTIQKDTVVENVMQKDTTENDTTTVTLDTIMLNQDMDSSRGTVMHDTAIMNSAAAIDDDVFASETNDFSDSARILIDKYKDDSSFVVIKKYREQHYAKLFLYLRGELTWIVPVAMGNNSLSDKLIEGDEGTPEGLFTIMEKNPKSMYIGKKTDSLGVVIDVDTMDLHSALRLNYPLPEDLERGLRDSLITKKQYDKGMKAHKNGYMPPQDTQLGSRILIHGGGSYPNWTLGCVALDNDFMDIVYAAAYVNPKNNKKNTHVWIE